MRIRGVEGEGGEEGKREEFFLQNSTANYKISDNGSMGV